MHSNKFISKSFNDLLAKYNFKLREQLNYSVRYESNDLIIILNYNPQENSNNLWLIIKEFQQIGIEDFILEEYFNIKLRSHIPELFVNNITCFFKGVGRNLLKGDKQTLIKLDKFNEDVSLNYHKNLIKEQLLEEVNKAWKESNYFNVIKFLDKINKEEISKSYMKKYQIAKKRLKI